MCEALCYLWNYMRCLELTAESLQRIHLKEKQECVPSVTCAHVAVRAHTCAIRPFVKTQTREELTRTEHHS